jgi:uncharacterized protein (TIGR03083 family)
MGSQGRDRRWGAATVKRVPTVVDRDRTIGLLRGEFAAILAFCRPLGPDQWAAPSSLPGWTLHDVLAHMLGTESALCGVEVPSVDISQIGHLRNPIAEANEVWVESMRPWSDEQLLDRFDEVTGQRLAALDAMDQADFDAPSWTPVGRDESYGRFMRIRHFDCFMHEHDMRLAVGAPPRDDAADLESCLDEVTTGIGYIVGRRAALPDGSRVRLNLSGPAPRTILVSVDGRAAVTEALDGPPTVEVTMPASLFLRLVGGREDPDPDLLGTVELGGDRQLADQLVAKLAYTI